MARVLSLVMSVMILTPMIAPLIGQGVLLAGNWRWVFGLIVPLCLVSMVCVFIFIRDNGERTVQRLDWTGFIALSLVITCVQLVMDRGERLDWFSSGEILGLSALMAWALYTFIVHTFTAKQPFISPRLFLDRNFCIGVVLVFIYGMLNFTPIVLLPPLLQNLKGWPDSLIGNMLATRGAGLRPRQ